MSLIDSLYLFLTNDTAINVAVDGRVYGLIQDTNGEQPCIVYSQIAAQRTQTLCATDKKVRSIMQMDVYAKTYAEAKEVANVLRMAISDFTGDMFGTRVATVILDSEVDLTDPEPGLYRVSQSYFIWFTEE